MSVPLVTLLGRMTLALLATVGAVTAFTIQAVRQAVQPPYYRQQIGRQMLEIGYYSLPVVGLTAIFTGMVLALQSYTGFARFSAESAIPNVSAISAAVKRNRRSFAIASNRSGAVRLATRRGAEERSRSPSSPSQR